MLHAQTAWLRLLVAALFAAAQRCAPELGELLYDLGERLQLGEDYRQVALAIAALPETQTVEVKEVEEVKEQVEVPKRREDLEALQAPQFDEGFAFRKAGGKGPKGPPKGRTWHEIGVVWVPRGGVQSHERLCLQGALAGAAALQ